MSQTYKRALCPKCQGVGYIFDVDGRSADDATPGIGKCKHCKGLGRTLVAQEPRRAPSGAYLRWMSKLFGGR